MINDLSIVTYIDLSGVIYDRYEDLRNHFLLQYAQGEMHDLSEVRRSGEFKLLSHVLEERNETLWRCIINSEIAEAWNFWCVGKYCDVGAQSPTLLQYDKCVIWQPAANIPPKTDYSNINTCLDTT